MAGVRGPSVFKLGSLTVDLVSFAMLPNNINMPANIQWS